MKSTTIPWLLALMMAMLPRNSHAANGPPPFQSLMMISSYAGRRHHQTAFLQLQRSNHDTLNSMMKTKLHNYNLNKFNISTRSEKNVVPTRIAMSSNSPLSSSSQRTSPSPWSPGKWKITLDFGKEELNNSFERNENSQQLANVLGEEWGSNSGRLVLSFDVMANAETNTRAESNNANANSVQMTWLGGKPTGTVECISQQRTNDSKEDYYCASYITEKGQQTVQISPGQWRIEPPLPLLPSYVNILPGQASTLRFHLTLLDSIRRNTIQFPRDQMLLLQSNTFRTEQYASGARTLLPYQYAKDVSQKQLEEQLNHETGDRRLDGKDIFETLGGYKDVAELVLERDERRRKWKEIEGALPKLDSKIDIGRKVDINKLLEDEKRWGMWPGDTEFMTIERGVVLAVVAKESKQKMGLFSWMQDGGGVEEPVVVGTWSAVPEMN
mmetsp:Transcript_291/g.563  ORF Transcript_291/g.563 Transcript_291/m.563 type:complete len:441 (+) Transcript_291:76-1398(+)